MPTRHDAPSAGGSAGEDLYAVLGVARTSTNDEIRKAYRKLARKCHPDVNPGDKSAEERFKQISRAHDALSDEKRRALYDEFGIEALQSGFDADRARQLRDWQRATRGGAGTGAGARPRRGRASSSAGERGFGGFEDLFGGMFSRGAVSERGADVEVAVPVDFLEAVRGASRSISVRRPQPCGSCQGVGETVRGACGKCGGAGSTEESVRLNVKIPPGVETGSRVRVAGKGGAGIDGGPSGDLFILVEVKPHPLLQREGNDLTLEVPVTIPEAVRGATVTVPTPEGDVALRIPAGTQSGRRLRLRGKGVPALHGGERGDLYVRIMVQVPEDDDRVRAALGSLEAAYKSDVRKDLRL